MSNLPSGAPRSFKGSATLQPTGAATRSTKTALVSFTNAGGIGKPIGLRERRPLPNEQLRELVVSGRRAEERACSVNAAIGNIGR